MRAGRRALALAVTLAASGGVAAQGWSLQGTNTLRLEEYTTAGASAASPYPFSGVQAYDELGLSLERRLSRWDRLRGQVFGVVNLSEYRSPDHGFVPERLNLTREKGDAAIPYRAELGDSFAYFSYRTLQRTTKGLQVDLQLRGLLLGARHSLLVFAGANESRWQELRPANDWSAGASWLADGESRGALALNAVFNHRDGRSRLATLDRDQMVVSVSGERRFTLPAQVLTLEAEVAHFAGDHDGVAGPASGQDRSGNGYFAELRGRTPDRRLDWRARTELYTQDFRPRGAVVTPDRRSVELHGGWRLAAGTRLRARLQAFDDGFETASVLRTRTAGVNARGPLLPALLPGVSGTVDAFYSRRWRDGRTVDQDVINVNASLSRQVAPGWTGRLDLFAQALDDDTAANADRRTWQLRAAADGRVRLGAWSGLVTPGLLARLIEGPSADGLDLQPTLALRLRRDRHTVGLDYGFLAQGRDADPTPDVGTHTLAFEYRYRRGPHTLGLELNWFGRDPDPGASTEAWRVSALWTVRFGRAAPPPAAPAAARVAPAAPAGPGIDLVSLAPGLELDTARAMLEAFGVTGGVPIDGFLVYEHPVLPGIDQRQRLVLAHSGGVLDVSALIVDFDDVGNVDTVAQTFERVREALIRRHGPPARLLEEGEFTPTFADDVNRERFVRVMEWDTPAGVLRFGIPRRLDGVVRMEAQHRRAFPDLRDPRWSLEEVR